LFIRDPCIAVFKEGLRAIPGVRDVACSSPFGIGGVPGRAPGPAKDTHGAYISVGQASISYEFFGLFGLKPIAGRFFSQAHPADAMPDDPNASVQGAVVLNEAAVRLLGFASPQDAIGKNTSLNEKTGALSEIIGVVPDYAFDAVHKAVPATVYTTGHEQQQIATWVRIDGTDTPETLAAIGKLWKRAGTPLPVLVDSLDHWISIEFYTDIRHQSTLFAVFAAVAVAIASLGLLGLALFTAEQRTKEIGIRKSMGATRRDILALLLWQFAKPVLLANLIAWPVAYYFMHRWLQGFAYRIDLAPWMFLAASALALAIALATVIGHALMVARAQPVTALRYE
jgi:putative ABC transport system permease protein